MRIFNVNKQIILDENVRELNTLGETMRGLLGAKEAFAVFLKTRWGIHTIGMRFSIDVVVCGEAEDAGTDVWDVGYPQDVRHPGSGGTLVVRALRENMKPFSFFFWNPRYWNVLELPAGTITATQTEVGDTLRITEEYRAV